MKSNKMIQGLLLALIGLLMSGCSGKVTIGEDAQYTVTATASAYGSVSPESSVVGEGKKAVFIISADNGYRINSISGCGGTLSGNNYTTEPINADCSVNVSFIEVSQGTQTYTINTSTGGKGVFTPSTFIVNKGENHTFQLLVNSGYAVDSVTGCGGSLGADVYTTGVIGTDCTVLATFITIVAPTLEAFIGNIEENATVDTVVGTVVILATGGADITAFILSDSTNFSIDTDGVITSNSTLDYETTSSYSLTVTATNSAGESVSVGVSITVGDVATDEPFIITVKTDNEGPSLDTEFTISTRIGEVYNYNVDCDNDGEDEAIGQTGAYTCNYNTAGTYTIKISDNVGDKTGYARIYLSDRNKIIAINQWGQSKWTSMGGAFNNCENLSNENVEVTDVPDLSNVTDMSSMFSRTSTFNIDIGDWNTSNVTNMEYMFSYATAFNQDIGDWNTSKVTTMENMFYSAAAFNQDIGRWDTGKVEWMYAMFDRAVHFNQDIGGWDTHNVVDMSKMFSGAVKFNHDIGEWNTSKVTSMDRMFRSAVDFNQNIEDWDTGKVRGMKSMFEGAVDFSNNDLSVWNVAGVIEHSRFFQGVGTGNTEPNWRVDPFIIVIKMNNFGFSDDNAFTIPTKQGETYNYNVDCDNDGVDEAIGVTGNYTCTYATPGNYQRRIAIRDNSGNLTGFPRIYFSSLGADKKKLLSIIRWGEGKWSSMERAFSGCTKLNQNYGSMQDKPDLSNVTDMSYMFRGATLFNADIRSWNTSNVRNMKGVFLNATAFNAKVEQWNTQNTINMDEMFKGASSFTNHDLSVWNVDNVLTNSLFLEGAGISNTFPNFP